MAFCEDLLLSPLTGWLVVVLWYWTSSTPEREREREEENGFHGSFGVSRIHFWAFKLILKPKVRVANRQSQGVKHIATSQFLSRWLEPSCGFMNDMYICQHPCIAWHYIQGSRSVTHHSISISVMKKHKRIPGVFNDWPWVLDMEVTCHPAWGQMWMVLCKSNITNCRKPVVATKIMLCWKYFSK